MAFTIPDGTATLYGGSGASPQTSGNLTTTAAGIVCACITINAGAGVSLDSVVCGSLSLNFLARSAAVGNNRIEVWTAYSSSTVNAKVATSFSGGTTSFCTIHAWGVLGGETSSYYDGSAVTNTSDADLSLTTGNADDALFGCYREGSTDNPSAGTNFTRILGGTGSGYTLSEYRVVSSTGTYTIARGSVGTNGGVAFAIKMAAAAGSAIKTVNGLALASVKTVNGLAIASVKTINGLA